MQSKIKALGRVSILVAGLCLLSVSLSVPAAVAAPPVEYPICSESCWQVGDWYCEEHAPPRCPLCGVTYCYGK